MRFVVFMMLIISILYSCKDKQISNDSRKKKSRVVKLFYNQLSDKNYIQGDSVITVKYLDSMYRVGDIIDLEGIHYKIID